MEDSQELTGRVIDADISEEMRTSYINYAMSVIISRALPDARDGLKPVHRRILYDMFEQGIRYNTPNKKCARIVGDVLGKYHPHGDASVYDALVRLGQDFSLRYPVVAPQGNFGSIDGDPPAAMRYTEARMSRIGEEMLSDIQKETVDFVPNYDDSTTEPAVLPAAFPFLLTNGSSGIAVGMATNLAPHNLLEVLEAQKKALRGEKFEIYPDFPGGGIMDVSEYNDGLGKVAVRARFNASDPKKLVSPRPEVLSILIPRFDVVIIEADGARHLPLKYHSQRDPVIVSETDATLAVMGASAYGRRVDDSVFGFESEALVDTAFLNFLIRDGEGALKGAMGRKVLFINQADEVALPLEGILAPVPLILGSLREDRIYGSL